MFPLSYKLFTVLLSNIFISLIKSQIVNILTLIYTSKIRLCAAIVCYILNSKCYMISI
ncbi:hypothetical protein CLU99_1776 [Flavobacterium sp. 2]|nr:hypothetical protein CLU99_1776 [Flavobacterium sp. 2]